MSDVINRTCAWFVAVGQMPPDPTPNVQQTAFYIGMQLEELLEKLEVLLPTIKHTEPNLIAMRAMSLAFKSGIGDQLVARALASPEGRKALLDADMDLLWVSIGGARAQGADVAGAYAAVTAANWDKAVDGVFQLAPETKRVLKRPGWQAPDLAPFIHNGEAS